MSSFLTFDDKENLFHDGKPVPKTRPAPGANRAPLGDITPSYALKEYFLINDDENVS